MMEMEMSYHSQVLVEEKAKVRILTLNRPKELNALSFHMVSRLTKMFLEYEKDPSVKLVILKGQGRAFCAGGDVPPLVLKTKEVKDLNSEGHLIKEKRLAIKRNTQNQLRTEWTTRSPYLQEKDGYLTNGTLTQTQTLDQ